MSDTNNNKVISAVKAFLGEFKSRLTDSPKRLLLKLAALVLTVAVLFAVSLVIVSASVKKVSSELISESIAAGEKYDCILILGAKVSGDTPSHMLSDRLDIGIDMYFDGVADKILMSGDSEDPDEYDETKVMKQIALSRGVPEEDIICDPYGLSTYDSIVRAKNVFGMESVAVITQDYHLYRALYICDKLELDVCGVSAGPNEKYAGDLKREVREIFARFKDMIYVLAGEEPKYATERPN